MLRPGEYRTVAFLSVCFIARGIYYASVLPLWEGYDEYSHYAYIEYVVQNARIPNPAVARDSCEVESSLRAYPLPWTQRGLRPGAVSYESWCALTASERSRRLAGVTPDWSEDPTGQTIYEAQQPPLYYWSMAPLLAMAERAGASLPARVFLLRCASVLLCALALPLGWKTAKRVLGSESLAIGVVAVAICMPEFLIDIARVGNESMAVLAGAALCLACVGVAEGDRGWLAALGTGAALGACLLTKVYFLAAVGAVAIIFLLARNRKFFAALPLALAIAAWWYAFIYRTTGDPTGMIQSVALRNVPLGQKLRVALHLDWFRGIDVALFSHIWFGGWSFLQLRAWIYHFFYAIFAAGLAGLLLMTIRGKWRPLAAPAVLEAALCAGLGYHVVLGQIGYRTPMTSGWYLYCFVFAEVVLLAAGLREIAPRRGVPWVLPGLAGLFAALDLYGLLCMQIPYYTGITAHLANGRLPALRFSQLPEAAAHAGGWWWVYFAATLAAVAAAVPRPTKVSHLASEPSTGAHPC